VVVIYTPTAEIHRPRIEEKYAAMPGMKKTFLFMAVREGVVLQRSYSCWCDACMQAAAPGEGSMDSNYVCAECPSNGLDSLTWKETNVEREDQAGVAARKANARAHAREQARQLQQHFTKESRAVWIAVQNRGEDDPDQYWIGRALRIEEVYKEASSSRGVGRAERYDAGDMRIAVEWFQRDISGGDERRIFKSWAADEASEDAGPEAGCVYTFNSTELRRINVQMQPVLPVGGVPLNVVQPGRRSVRAAAAAATAAAAACLRGVTRRVAQQRADQPEQLWEIPAADERLILEKCA
jgi:hypothetical protein